MSGSDTGRATAENGCTKPRRALAHDVTATSKRRLRATPSDITGAPPDDSRRLVGIAIGLI